LKKRDRKKDIGVDEIILLKGTLKKEDGRMRTEFRSENSCEQCNDERLVSGDDRNILRVYDISATGD
jgi:hypothetical protein